MKVELERDSKYQNLRKYYLNLIMQKKFAKIDLREGYQQIELDLSSRHVTAFITQEDISIKMFSLSCKTSI